jgi:hypothetical protein
MRRRHKVRYEPPCGPSGQREQSNGDQKAAEETESCSQVLLTHVRHLNLHVRRRTRSILAKWAVKRELGTQHTTPSPGETRPLRGASHQRRPSKVLPRPRRPIRVA